MSIISVFDSVTVTENSVTFDNLFFTPEPFMYRPRGDVPLGDESLGDVSLIL